MKIPNKLIKLSRADKGTLSDRIHKLHEEAGEVTEGYLRLKGRKNNRGRNKNDMYKHIIEETIDTLIMTMDILTYMGFTRSRDIERLVDRKLNKWDNTLKTR